MGVVTVALWIAALATKETAAMFPFVFLAYDWLGVQGSAPARRRRLLTVHLPMIATAVVAGIVRLFILARIEYPGQVSVHWSYLLLELDVVRRYLWMMINPSGQAIFHEVTTVGLLDPRTWLAIVVVAGLLALSWNVRRSNWPASIGMLWFFLALVPSSVLAVLDQGEPMAEHRVYMASCGLFLAVGAWIGRLAEWGANPAEAGHYAGRTSRAHEHNVGSAGRGGRARARGAGIRRADSSAECRVGGPCGAVAGGRGPGAGPRSPAPAARRGAAGCRAPERSPRTVPDGHPPPPVGSDRLRESGAGARRDRAVAAGSTTSFSRRSPSMPPTCRRKTHWPFSTH